MSTEMDDIEMMEEPPELGKLVRECLTDTRQYDPSILTILSQHTGSTESSIDELAEFIQTHDKVFRTLEGSVRTRELGTIYHSIDGFGFKHAGGKKTKKGLTAADMIGEAFFVQYGHLSDVFGKREVASSLFDIYNMAKGYRKAKSEAEDQEAMQLGRELLPVRKYMDGKRDALLKDISQEKVKSALVYMLTNCEAAQNYVEMVGKSQRLQATVNPELFYFAQGMVNIGRFASSLSLVLQKDKMDLLDDVIFSFARNLDDVAYGFCLGTDLLTGKDDSDVFNNLYSTLRSINDKVIEGLPENSRGFMTAATQLMNSDLAMIPTDPIGDAYVALYALMNPETMSQMQQTLKRYQPKK